MIERCNDLVHNMPEYALDYKYVVATLDGGILWFWGAWDDIDEANAAARENEFRVVLEVCK